MLEYNFPTNDHFNIFEYTTTPAATKLPFYINSIGDFNCTPDYFTKRDNYDQYLLIYTLEGEGFFEYNGKTKIIPPNHAIVIDCNKYQYYTAKSANWHFLWFHFNGESCSTIINQINHTDFHIVSDDTLSILQILRQMIECSTQTLSSLVDLELSFYIHELLVIFSKKIEASSASILQTKHLSEIETCVNLIQVNYSHKIKMDELAKSVGLSKYYFIKLFAQIMGKTPYEYLLYYRIIKAKQFLIQSDSSVYDIALLCGFCDEKNFIVQFKKYTQMTPLQYRKSIYLP